jgi:CheY-like chemotaxis protein
MIQAQNLRILLVDDDPLLLRSLRETLEADGHVVTTAGGGREGIDLFLAAAASTQPYAVVITDLGMPHIDGTKVAAAVNQADPTVPIILLTGWGQRLLAEGDTPPYVNRVLAKPPKLIELRSALVKLTRAQGRDSKIEAMAAGA